MLSMWNFQQIYILTQNRATNGGTQSEITMTGEKAYM